MLRSKDVRTTYIVRNGSINNHGEAAGRQCNRYTGGPGGPGGRPAGAWTHTVTLVLAPAIKKIQSWFSIVVCERIGHRNEASREYCSRCGLSNFEICNLIVRRT